jgi:RNA polymerase sigma factor (sigma-70 family)
MLEAVGEAGRGVDEHRRLVEALYRQSYRRLVGTASLILGDAGLGEDVVQDAFAALYGRYAALDDPSTGEGYLYRSVLNGCRSRQRRRRIEDRAQPLTGSGDLSIEDLAVEDDAAEAIGVALLRLPLRQRECVVCHYQLELSHREVADALGISIGSVKKHLHRATRRLATLLEDHR